MANEPVVLSQAEKEQQLRAAYALNMCNVSVAQIVQYNDAYILDQEYDTILNNLNLEQMPKDEALLNILVELLNTITFFRIQEVKKVQIEKQYQNKMKNAIWNAVPNIGLIMATGNPIAMAVSLASQVGIGYMNYRKEKAHTVNDTNEKEVELQITALEQFNALKRELFTTAWRLADKYHFPDRYRLTEKQILQYNEILMDSDELRKYARLEAIQDKFEAYPQFWYYMGHTACYISLSESLQLDRESRMYYHAQAEQHFEKYFELNRFNILREDHISASAALEYSDLLLLGAPDSDNVKEKVIKRLDECIGMAGNSKDILQLFALSYLKCGAVSQAERLLKILINESYNTLTNAKILSRLYASQYLFSDEMTAHRIHANYNTLALRVDTKYLFPMPREKCTDEHLIDQYVQQQKDILTREYLHTLRAYAERYNIYYRRAMTYNGASGEDTLKILNEMLCGLDNLEIFRKHKLKQFTIDTIRKEVYRFKDNLDGLTKVSFRTLTSEFFEELSSRFAVAIHKMAALDSLEGAYLDLVFFCEKENLPLPAPEMQTSIRINENTESIQFVYFDAKKIKAGKSELSPEMKKILCSKISETLKSSSQFLIKRNATQTIQLFDNDSSFDLYFKERNLNTWRSEVFMLLQDKSSNVYDLWFTLDGLIVVNHGSVGAVIPYQDVSLVEAEMGSYLDIGWPNRYDNPDVDIPYLSALLVRIAKLVQDKK